MNKFEKQLEKWNNGVLRGAQAKLAKTLGVSTATAALWANGKRRPSKGYVAQMALLFNMDAFDVFKLFDYRSTTYPEPKPNAQARTLRDQEIGDCSYNAGGAEFPYEEESPEQSNSVRLPFLNRIPPYFPQYDEAEVIEWWSVPRRYAQGAKYILRSTDAGLDDAKDGDDLCFVKPGSDLPEGKVVLLEEKEGQYGLRRVKRENGKLVFCRTDGKSRESNPSGRVLGTLLRRIRSL